MSTKRSSMHLRVGHCCKLAFAILPLIAGRARADDGVVQTLRDDVRQGAPSEPSSPSKNPFTQDKEPGSWGDNSWLTAAPDDAVWIIPCFTAMAITSPFWAPYTFLDDSFSRTGEFLSYPYEHAGDYMVMGELPGQTRSMAGRIDIDYVSAFDHVDRVGGRLLLSTATRFDLDAQVQHLEEHLPHGARDRTTLGDCNLTFRFAQNQWAQFRSGLGINWLDDSHGTDLGFNFTYGADIFPCRPLALSSTIDWGTLGHASLFRVRTTAGVLIRRFEVYTGYEYTAIERTHWNGLIGGLSVFF